MSVRLVGEDYKKHGQWNTGGRRKRQRGVQINGEKIGRLVGDKSPDRNDGRAGTISINFFSNEELNAFINKMMAEKMFRLGQGGPKLKKALMEL